MDMRKCIKMWLLSKRECLDANTLIYCQQKDVKRYKMQPINRR